MWRNFKQSGDIEILSWCVCLFVCVCVFVCCCCFKDKKFSCSHISVMEEVYRAHKRVGLGV